jgi:predicted metal-dependent hydrolase
MGKIKDIHQPTILLANTEYPYNIRYSKRKTIGIQIKPDGSIWVCSPKRVLSVVLEEVLQKKSAWILKQLCFFRNSNIVHTNKPYTKGSLFPILGRKHKVLIEYSNSESVHFSKIGIRIFVKKYSTINQKLIDSKVDGLLEKWYRKCSLVYLKKRFSKLHHKINLTQKLPVVNLSIRKMKRRWGSCCKQTQSIVLNSELLKTPSLCIDYVIAHEIAHLFVADHSPKFYKVLDKIFPKWKQAKSVLNQYVQV